MTRERTLLSDLDQGMLQVMYQGFVVGVLAVLIYGKVLELIGPMMGTMFLAISPFLIPFMAFLILDDQIDLGDVTGLALVAVSMIISFWNHSISGKRSLMVESEALSELYNLTPIFHGRLEILTKYLSLSIDHEKLDLALWLMLSLLM